MPICAAFATISSDKRRKPGSSHRYIQNTVERRSESQYPERQGMAKAYQVRQVLRAIERLKGENEEERPLYLSRNLVGRRSGARRALRRVSEPELVGRLARGRSAESERSSPRSSKTCRPTEKRFPRRWRRAATAGNSTVRVPPEVHRHLAVEAAEAGVSLNRLAMPSSSRQRHFPLRRVLCNAVSLAATF